MSDNFIILQLDEVIDLELVLEFFLNQFRFDDTPLIVDLVSSISLIQDKFLSCIDDYYSVYPD